MARNFLVIPRGPNEDFVQFKRKTSLQKNVLLWHLSKQTRRFNELQRLLPNISKDILSCQLRELEEDPMVHREVYKEFPPKSRILANTLRTSFIPIMVSMAE